MSKAKLQSTIENAIAKADSSYFFEDYTKQAVAVLNAIDNAGFSIIPKTLPDDTFLRAADEMKTGRLKPEEHVKDVYQTILRITALK